MTWNRTSMALALTSPKATRVVGTTRGGKSGREINRRKPIESDMSWQAEGLCRDEDPELFYPSKGGNAKINEARKVCKLCPVVNECLSFALSVPAIDDWGVWGATSKDERERLRRTKRKAA